MSERPRVLFVFSSNDEYGACLSMLDFVVGLPERGYDPLVALQEGTALQPRLEAAGIPWRPIFTKGWKGHPERKPYKRIRDRARDLLTGRRVGAWARAQGVGLVHSNTLTSPVGAFVAKTAGVPHVWHMREAVDTIPGTGFLYGWEASSRLMNRMTDMVIGNSEYIVEQTARYVDRAKLRLLYGGPLDPAEATRPLPERAPLSTDRLLRLLVVGRVSSRKGQHDAIEAVAHLRARGIAARLTLAGEGNARDVREAKEKAAGLGVEVDWPGYVDPRPLYASHDASLVCGPNDPIPRVAIEANACGIPTVGVRSGGIPEVIVEGETGWLCDEGDGPGLADALERAARLPPAAQAEILREGHQRAYRRFNWTRYRDEGVALYRELGL